MTSNAEKTLLTTKDGSLTAHVSQRQKISLASKMGDKSAKFPRPLEFQKIIFGKQLCDNGKAESLDVKLLTFA